MAKKLDLTKLTADEVLYLKAKEKYYEGNPIMTDVEFDILEDQLRAADSFVIDVVGSITIKGNVATFKSVKGFLPHASPMGSLAKIQFKPNYVPYKEFAAWLSKCGPNTNIQFEPKLDGNAINIIYENGALKAILSRGDGVEGQDYTAKLKGNVPNVIKGFTGEVRGEAVVDTYLFDTQYKSKVDGDGLYKNARNWVAGTLAKGGDGLSDIAFVAYEIVGYTGNTKEQLLKWGFDVHDISSQLKASVITEEDFVKVHDSFARYRQTCKYQLDGIVAKMDESVREELGRNNHHPHWALAIKFVAEAVVTKIVDITWTLSKRGELCPVAILEPVELMGSTVTKASVYNASWMLAKKAYPGATVSLIKSGDIIPKIVEILEPSKIAYNLPTEWNGKNVSYNEVQLILEGFEDTDEFKSVQLSNSIIALGIEGIGPATCERLVEAGIDLFSLLSFDPQGLRMKLLNSGLYKDGRELEILIDNVFKITKVELWQVIYAMQFKNCGKTISKQLANYMCHVPYDFKGLTKSVVEAFVNDTKQQDETKKLVGILLANNVDVVKPVAPKAGLITFEMTGDCTTHGSKKEFAREVEASGKCKHASLSKDTTYLVTASKASMTTKMQKAEKNGTKIVTYDEFLDIIKNA